MALAVEHLQRATDQAHWPHAHAHLNERTLRSGGDAVWTSKHYALSTIDYVVWLIYGAGLCASLITVFVRATRVPRP